MKKGKRRLLTIQLLVFFISTALLYLALASQHQHDKEQHLQLVSDRYQRAYSTIYSQLHQFAESVYLGIVTRYSVPELYTQLPTADEEQKNTLRAELLSKVEPRYKELKKAGSIRQLHFHLADNESFLRLHRPEKFGDNLTGIRETVNYVNTHHKPIDGFEEGKIFCGYRFVFPITSKDNIHLGSMEISFGPSVITGATMKQYFVLSNFFIKKEIAEQKVFQDALKEHYLESPNPDYLFEKSVLAVLKKEAQQELKVLQPNQDTVNTIFTNAEKETILSFYDAGMDVVITTIPVFNPITNEMIAFLTVRSKSNYFSTIKQQFYVYFILGVSLLVMILSSFYLLQSKRMMLEENTKLLEQRVALRTEELQKSKKEVQTSERRLLAILDSIPDSILQVDLDTTIAWANKTALALNESVIGKPCSEAFPEKKITEAGAPFSRAKATGTIQSAVVCKPDTTNGDENYWDDIAIPLKDNEGKVTGILIVSRDITELKKAEKALHSTLNELEQRVEERTLALQKANVQLLHAEKLTAVGNLAASIAHEFNNPLQGVTNILKGVSRRAIFEEDDAKLITVALNECYRMRDLIKNLQDFNRPTSGEKTSLDIHTAMEDTLLLCKKEFKSKNIVIETIFAHNMPAVTVVADQIKQVFLNLINNAADACQQGDVITITTEALDNNVAIRIHDTGKGIDNDDVQHIFEPFFTTKPEIKGTGLGLSVSYGIIKKHNGEILVESDPDNGTTFSIILPIDGVANEKSQNTIG